MSDVSVFGSGVVTIKVKKIEEGGGLEYYIHKINVQSRVGSNV